MDNLQLFKNRSIRRVPSIIVLLFIVLLGFPVIVFNLFGVDAHLSSIGLKSAQLNLSSHVQSYLIHTILQWTAFVFAVVTVLLAFIQYRLTNDRVALLIGSVVLFSGSYTALNVLIVSLPTYLVDNANSDSLIWTFSNAISGIIFIMGFLILLRSKKQTIGQVQLFATLLGLLFLVGLVSLYYIKELFSLFSSIGLRSDFIHGFHGIINIIIYLAIILFVYPSAYKKYPGILTSSIFYISVAQIVVGIYLMLLSPVPYDSAYNLAYFLKVIIYFIPFLCVLINYAFSYQLILDTQTKLHLEQEKLKFIAAHDPLTNLYTRREFEQLLDLTIANHLSKQEKFALFLIDIDNFKSINDTLGHVYGDSFLLKFSQQLSALTRKGDILSRIGGDEFTIIIPSIKSIRSARILAARIISSLNMPYDVGEKLLTGSASLGIAVYPADGESSEELFKNADIAMYNAKKMGKNTYQCYTDKLSEEKHRESEVESYLRDALKKNELTLYFQPQYNLVTKEIVGAEVLLRWNNAVLGQVSPLEFIPIAENSNLIINIGNWVLEKACQQAKQWSHHYKKDLHFSINVSPVQFEHRNFISHLKSTLNILKFSAEHIGIEITETLLMNNDDEVLIGLNEVGSLGSHILLDDFGVGYSSLLRLQSLPIHTLKIDKSFVSAIKGGTKKVVIIDTIISLAEELGMSVIAEGIETEEQLNYLLSKKCVVGQGFYLAKPMSADDFETLAYLD